MKIALVNTMTPFVRGGAEILVDDLRGQLAERGHQVELFRLPFPNDYAVGLPELVLASKLLDFSSYDRVIAFKFPAYCVCHRHRTLWLFHQFRQVYDLFDKQDGLPRTTENEALRQLIARIDNTDIPTAEHVFVNAQEVQNRLRDYNALTSELLPPPLLNMQAYRRGEYGDYFYCPSRVNPLKRQHLAVEAMRYVKTKVRLVIDGICIGDAYVRQLRELIRTYHLESKVVYENRWVEDSEKIEKLSRSLGVLYIPYLEDSCGFVTYEGFYSGKPVLSCTDSGGTKEFITDGINGFLVDPTPEALAEKMDLLYKNRKKAQKMGQCAYKSIIEKDITWDSTIRRLLA